MGAKGSQKEHEARQDPGLSHTIPSGRKDGWEIGLQPSVGIGSLPLYRHKTVKKGAISFHQCKSFLDFGPSFFYYAKDYEFLFGNDGLGYIFSKQVVKTGYRPLQEEGLVDEWFEADQIRQEMNERMEEYVSEKVPLLIIFDDCMHVDKKTLFILF